MRTSNDADGDETDTLQRKAKTMALKHLEEVARELGASVAAETLETETAFALDYLGRLALYREDAPAADRFASLFTTALSIMIEADDDTPARAFTPAAISWALAQCGVDARPAPSYRAEDRIDADEAVERAVVMQAGLHLAGHEEGSDIVPHLDEPYDLTSQRDHLADIAFRRLSTDPEHDRYAPDDRAIEEAVARCCVLGQYMGEPGLIGHQIRALSRDGMIVAIPAGAADPFDAVSRAIADDAKARGLPHRGARAIARRMLDEALEGAWMGTPHLLDLPAFGVDADDPEASRRLRAHLVVVLVTVMRSVSGHMPDGMALEAYVKAHDMASTTRFDDALALTRHMVDAITAASVRIVQEEWDAADDGDALDALVSMTPEQAAGTHLSGDMAVAPAPTTPVTIDWCVVYRMPRRAAGRVRDALEAIGVDHSSVATGGPSSTPNAAWSGPAQAITWERAELACAHASRLAPSGVALMRLREGTRDLVAYADNGTVVVFERTTTIPSSERLAN